MERLSICRKCNSNHALKLEDLILWRFFKTVLKLSKFPVRGCGRVARFFVCDSNIRVDAVCKKDFVLPVLEVNKAKLSHAVSLTVS